MAVNPTSGTSSQFTWTPTAAAAQPVTIQVTDHNGATATQTFTLNVVSAAAPSITSTGVTPVTAGQLYRYDVVTNVPSGGTPVTYTLSGPSGMAIDANGHITWQVPTEPKTASVYTKTVSVTATDTYGLKSPTQTYTLTVNPDQTAPQVTLDISPNPDVDQLRRRIPGRGAWTMWGSQRRR